MIGQKGIPFPAGIENFTEQIGHRLAERGHDVTVYTRPYVEVGDSYRGMRIRRLPSINTKHLDALSHTLLASLDTLFQDFDIVHFHALGPSVFSLVPQLRGIRTIAHVHGLDWQRAKWSPAASACLRLAEGAAVYFPHRTVAISANLQQYLEEKYGRAVAYVPTGVDLADYVEPLDIRRWGLSKERYFLFLSRIVPEKGCHHLLDAYRRLDTALPLVVAGSSSHTDAYESSLREAGGSNVIFTGTVTGRTLHELFANAYAYVIPSEVEGLPHTLLQALSHGRCVVASDIPPNTEALGGCGITFRSKDVGDLAEKLRFVLDHPAFVAGCAEPARRRAAEQYAWDTVVDRLEALYEDCLAGRPRASRTLA